MTCLQVELRDYAACCLSHQDNCQCENGTYPWIGAVEDFNDYSAIPVYSVEPGLGGKRCTDCVHHLAASCPLYAELINKWATVVPDHTDGSIRACDDFEPLVGEGD